MMPAAVASCSLIFYNSLPDVALIYDPLEWNIITDVIIEGVGLLCYYCPVAGWYQELMRAEGPKERQGSNQDLVITEQLANSRPCVQYYYALGRQCTQTLPYLAEVCIPACS